MIRLLAFAGSISATIVNISREINNPTIIDRSVKYEKTVIVKGPPDGVTVWESKLEWRLKHKNESTGGTVVAEETTFWTINRRSIPIGNYQIKFTVSYSVETNPSELSARSHRNVLEASDYGFIKVVKAPLFAVIDGGTSVRWGSQVISSVNGALSYDGDVGLESNDGLHFGWSCRRSDKIDFSSDCYSSFINGTKDAVVTINASRLQMKETYVLRLIVCAADDRSSFAEMKITVESGELPLLFLR